MHIHSWGRQHGDLSSLSNILIFNPSFQKKSGDVFYTPFFYLTLSFIKKDKEDKSNIHEVFSSYLMYSQIKKN